MATGARIPAPGGMTVQPTVKTRKKVPMNSTRYFFMVGGSVRRLSARRRPNERFLGLRAGRIRASLRLSMQLKIPEGDFSGYIFDLDGTLVDTMPLHYTAWEAALRKAGLEGPLDENLFYELGGVPSRKVASLLGKRHGLNLDPVAVYRDKEDAFMGSLEKLALIAPVVEFARRISKTHPVAIASGGTRDVVASTLGKDRPGAPLSRRGHGGRRRARQALAGHVPPRGQAHGGPAEGMPRVRGRPARHQGGRGRRDAVGLCLQPAVSVTAWRPASTGTQVDRVAHLQAGGRRGVRGDSRASTVRPSASGKTIHSPSFTSL